MYEGEVDMDTTLQLLDTKLIRALTEVRYARSFLFDDLKQLNRISKGLRQNFHDTQRDDSNGALVLINHEKQAIAAVHAESVSVEVQKPLSNNDFEEMSLRVIDEVSENLDIEEYSRIGHRYFFGKQIQSVESGQEILKRKFFNKFSEKLNSEIKNPRIAFTFQKSETVFVNVSLGIEVNAAFELSPTGVVHSHDSYLLFDIDVFTNSNYNFKDFLSESQNVSKSTLNSIIELMEI